MPSSTPASAGSSASTSSASTTSVFTHGPLDDIPDLTLHKLRRAFLIFRGEFSPRDLFIYEEESAIDDEVKRLKDEGSSLLGGALRNRAIKRLWTQEKKVEYANKVDPLSEDIQE
jgi:hypothetical protein